jgi:hypothetical protein
VIHALALNDGFIDNIKQDSNKRGVWKTPGLGIDQHSITNRFFLPIFNLSSVQQKPVTPPLRKLQTFGGTTISNEPPQMFISELTGLPFLTP